MRAPERDSNKNWRTEHHGHIGIVIHSNALLDAELRTSILDRVRRALEAAKGRADHVTVEIEKMDAPRRTPNVDCRIDVHAWHAGPMAKIEVRGKDPEDAANRALKQLPLALHRAVREQEGLEVGPNAHADTAGMTSTLEDSEGRPSRKSSRRATNRIKGATQLTRRTKRNVHAPQTRAARDAAR